MIDEPIGHPGNQQKGHFPSKPGMERHGYPHDRADASAIDPEPGAGPAEGGLMSKEGPQYAKENGAYQDDMSITRREFSVQVVQCGVALPDGGGVARYREGAGRGHGDGELLLYPIEKEGTRQTEGGHSDQGGSLVGSGNAFG